MNIFKTTNQELYVVNEQAVTIGDFQFMCYSLNNGDRAFLLAQIFDFINIYQGTNEAATITSADTLYAHLNVIQPFLPFMFIRLKMRKPISFKSGNLILQGISSGNLEILLKAFIKARQARKLPRKYLKLAGLAEQYFHTQKTSSQPAQGILT